MAHQKWYFSGEKYDSQALYPFVFSIINNNSPKRINNGSIKLNYK